ncbi:MAG TPA: threonylcarbamoyl-AMP synthase [Bacteroidales bacterium]|jgi:tRNA threonylcarbamoyl adenosine modification protein (Sua5/YciO/YrdC/YwlC family)|nr:threonylcarbamoyl-AMP synthase [Bacteroidales bacterium]
MLIRIHPDNPGVRQVSQVVDILKKGGVIVYPTDTVYGLGCDIFNPRAVERIARIKGLRPEKANFSFICHDLSQISDYTRHLSNHVFKLMKHYLPGAFTFILPANNRIPKLFKNKKKTIGIRIPANNIPLEIVRQLGNPLLTTSIHDSDELLDYTTDPELIHENMGHLVDAVIDGGFGNNIPSTILDCTGDEVEIIRQGLGEFEG